MAYALRNRAYLETPVPFRPIFSSTNSNATCNNTGHSAFAVGHVWLTSGPGTSKTLDSTAGCNIYWATGSVTWNNATNNTTNVRVGVQAVTATGVNDDNWTGKPQADLLAGTATVSANAVMKTAIASGSLSIANGDLLAIGFEMTAHGSTDSVTLRRPSLDVVASVSDTAIDTGSGPGLSGFVGMVAIEFADGTFGYLEPDIYPHIYEASSTFSNASTPDEIALVMQWPYPVKAAGLCAFLGSIAAADDFELILYSDPLGSPVAQKTLTFDSDLYAVGNNRHFAKQFSAYYDIAANTNVAVAVRPTTANTITYQRMNLSSGNGNLRKATQLGTNWSMYSRSDQTGAFGSQDTTILPAFGVYVIGHDDATGGAVAGSVTVGGLLVR